jgi:hypothetical protein
VRILLTYGFVFVPAYMVFNTPFRLLAYDRECGLLLEAIRSGFVTPRHVTQSHAVPPNTQRKTKQQLSIMEKIDGRLITQDGV